MRAYRSLAVACAIGISALGAHAGAQSAADKARAGSLFKQGISDMEGGKFDDGCPKIEESLQLDRQPGTLFTLAEREASRDQVKTALALYHDYLDWFQRMTLDQQGKQGKRQPTAQQQAAKLELLVPELTLTLPPGVPSGTVVTLDDAVVASSDLGRPLPVNPGVRVVTTKAPGGQLTKTRVMIGKGAKQQVMLAVSVPPQANTPAPPGSGSASAAPPAPPPSTSSSAAPPAPPPSTSSSAAPPAPPASASASAPPPPLPSVAPPPTTTLPGGAPPSDAPGVPGAPRLHIESRPPVTLVAVGDNSSGTFHRSACDSPCDQIIDSRGWTGFFFAGEGIPESSRFQLRDKTGDVRVLVQPGSSAVRTGGIALTTMGSLGTLLGAPILIVGAAGSNNSGAVAAGGALLGVGVTALATGIVMIVKSETSFQFRSGMTPGVIRF